MLAATQCTSAEFIAASTAYCNRDYEQDSMCISSAVVTQPTILLVLVLMHFLMLLR
jgi:hypothetical protein